MQQLLQFSAERVDLLRVSTQRTVVAVIDDGQWVDDAIDR